MAQPVPRRSAANADRCRSGYPMSRGPRLTTHPTRVPGHTGMPGHAIITAVDAEIVRLVIDPIGLSSADERRLSQVEPVVHHVNEDQPVRSCTLDHLTSPSSHRAAPARVSVRRATVPEVNAPSSSIDHRHARTRLRDTAYSRSALHDLRLSLAQARRRGHRRGRPAAGLPVEFKSQSAGSAPTLVQQSHCCTSMRSDRPGWGRRASMKAGAGHRLAEEVAR